MGQWTSIPEYRNPTRPKASNVSMVRLGRPDAPQLPGRHMHTGASATTVKLWLQDKHTHTNIHANTTSKKDKYYACRLMFRRSCDQEPIVGRALDCLVEHRCNKLCGHMLNRKERAQRNRISHPNASKPTNTNIKRQDTNLKRDSIINKSMWQTHAHTMPTSAIVISAYGSQHLDHSSPNDTHNDD